ncbi:MAG: replication initiator protein [Microviridae sp.]|nr:MAG: replication initiator protein [Microviridae sp.]
MHEASLHEASCFVTLTYDDAHAPVSLDYSHFQLFMKSLRPRLGPLRFRYFVCGEYGGELGRPHFHAGIFGTAFRVDRYPWRKAKSGHQVYRSPLLEEVWDRGLSEVGELTQESAGYMARYVLKKMTGPVASEHYVDRETGEVLLPEFCHMSLRPGIGAQWFRRFQADVFPHDRVIVKGVKTRVPRYYDQLLARDAPDLMEAAREARRIVSQEKGGAENTVERLAVREQVLKARLSNLKRKL